MPSPGFAARHGLDPLTRLVSRSCGAQEVFEQPFSRIQDSSRHQRLRTARSVTNTTGQSRVLVSKGAQ